MSVTSWLADPRLDAAVEIAPGWVTVVTGSASAGAGRLRAAHSEPLPDGAVTASLTEPNVVDRAAVVDALRRALAATESRPRRVALVVPDLAARVSLVSFDRVPARREDLDQLVRWQVKRAAPFPIEEATIGYTPVRTDADGGQTFAVVVARRDVIRGYEEACAELGAQAGLVDVATLAAVNLVLGAGRARGDDWLLVHVRPEYTSLAVMRGAELLFFRTRLAGEGGGVPEMVHQTVMYYHDRLGGKEFGQVFLTGRGRGPAALEDARRELDARLGVVVEPVDPGFALRLPEDVARDGALLEIAAPGAGMLVRAEGEAVAV